MHDRPNLGYLRGQIEEDAAEIPRLFRALPPTLQLPIEASMREEEKRARVDAEEDFKSALDHFNERLEWFLNTLNEFLSNYKGRSPVESLDDLKARLKFARAIKNESWDSEEKKPAESLLEPALPTPSPSERAAALAAPSSPPLPSFRHGATLCSWVVEVQGLREQFDALISPDEIPAERPHVLPPAPLLQDPPDDDFIPAGHHSEKSGGVTFVGRQAKAAGLLAYQQQQRWRTAHFIAAFLTLGGFLGIIAVSLLPTTPLIATITAIGTWLSLLASFATDYHYQYNRALLHGKRPEEGSFFPTFYRKWKHWALALCIFSALGCGGLLGVNLLTSTLAHAITPALPSVLFVSFVFLVVVMFHLNSRQHGEHKGDPLEGIPFCRHPHTGAVGSAPPPIEPLSSHLATPGVTSIPGATPAPSPKRRPS